MEEGSDRVVLKLPAFLALHKALQRRVIRSAIERLRGNLLGFYSVHVEMIRKWAAETVSGKTLELPAALWALREGEHLVLTKASPFKSEPFHWAILDSGSYSFPGFKVNIHFRDRIPGEPETACSQTEEGSCVFYVMDADKVLWPLAVRSWNPGDRFRPLGLHGSKKVQDFFTDSKIPRTERAHVPLLWDQEKICVILGRRMDDRVKITPETKRLLVVEFCGIGG
jgi:tRNA(Ile)-lysidine synthase